MSAFISVAGASSLAMITDGAAYDEDGVVVRIGRKVTVAKEVPLAITTRGNHGVGQAHQKRLCDAADYLGVDDAIQSFEDALDEMAAQPENGGRDYMHWHIVAFSESRGLIRLSAHNMPFAFADGEQPGQLKEVSGVYAAGNKIDLPGLVAVGVSPMQPGEDPADYMAREGANVMEAMRRKRSEPLEGETHGGQYVIGGQCDLTVVTPAGATVKTVRTWPDRVGSLINPLASAADLPRQQRRALERELRKRSA